MEEQLKQQTKKDGLTEVERARREVKEEATKGEKADMEVLNAKLLHLENVARKSDHKDKDKFTIVLSRFVAHKGKPSFAASLMLTLLSTKEEATIYEKEQKMIKRFGEGALPSSSSKTTTSDANPPQASPAYPVQTWPMNSAGMPLVLPQMVPFWQSNMGVPLPPMPSAANPIRSPRPRLNTTPYANKAVCFRCRKPGHFSRDCPLNQQ